MPIRTRSRILLINLAGYLVAVDDLPGAAAAAREAIGIRAAREPDHAHVAVAIEHLALVFALRGDHARAAILEGYADAAFARHGFEREFTETTTHDRLTALLREELAPDELARLTAGGRCTYTGGCDRTRVRGTRIDIEQQPDLPLPGDGFASSALPRFAGARSGDQVANRSLAYAAT